eukprot:TRINITY_DN4960_c0_g1_i1.p1 TRINITY_DN4960_c0_g1~~TRINITY_DN4960_c0_g1_i1.p1  ORF type:complete len:230 (+),score=44.49 TRINITY_DN4960_c0_g1_i1:353-1042(+)
MTDSISFKVVYAKKPYVITNLQKDSTVGELKAHLHELTGLPPATQKLLKGGILKDDTKTLQEVKVTEGCKVMLVGTKIADMLTVATVETDNSKKGSFEADSKKKEVPICEQAEHKKVLDQGIPVGAEEGKAVGREAIPRNGISNVNTKHGKVRLSFKSAERSLWIASNTSTQKLPYATIRTVTSTPITNHPGYSIVLCHLGPQSRYCLYFVPSQYVEAIKDEILGKFQF